MKIKSLLLLSLFAILTSCSKHNEYKEFVDFGVENRWQKSDAKTFEFDISDVKAFDVDVTNGAQLFDIVFRFSHVYDYQFASVPLNVVIESPDGKTEELQIDLPIKDDSGKDLGECAVDVCDLKYTIKEKTKLQKGIYKVTISHSFEGPYLPNVLGIGLNVESVK
jgi:gliding motility-associated lipoprotein GldH